MIGECGLAEACWAGIVEPVIWRTEGTTAKGRRERGERRGNTGGKLGDEEKR